MNKHFILYVQIINIKETIMRQSYKNSIIAILIVALITVIAFCPKLAKGNATTAIIDNLTTDNGALPLSARQGKKLNDRFSRYSSAHSGPISGYAPLNESGIVSSNYLGTGGASTDCLKKDGTYGSCGSAGTIDGGNANRTLDDTIDGGNAAQ